MFLILALNESFPFRPKLPYFCHRPSGEAPSGATKRFIKSDVPCVSEGLFITLVLICSWGN